MSEERRELADEDDDAPPVRLPGAAHTQQLMRREVRQEQARKAIPTLRSKRTNDPLSLPPSLKPHSSEGRRWRDLCAAYSKQLGPAKMAQEQTRVLLSNLVGLTLISERIVGNPETDLSHIIQLGQSIRGLLVDLGLNDKSKPDRIPTVAEYIASRDPGQ